MCNKRTNSQSNLILQIFDFYNDSSKVESVVDFDDESLVTDLVNRANYNYNDVLLYYYIIY